MINPGYGVRTASSVCAGDGPGTGHNQGKLDSPQAWSPGAPQLDEWYQIDLEAVRPVCGIVTQGRGNEDVAQWVTTYKVDVSSDGEDWSWVDDETTFTASADCNSRVAGIFAAAVVARCPYLVTKLEHLALNASGNYSIAWMLGFGGALAALVLSHSLQKE